MKTEHKVTEAQSARGLMRLTRIHPEVSVSTSKLVKDESYRAFEAKNPTNTKDLDFETMVLLRSSVWRTPVPLAMFFSETQEKAEQMHHMLVEQWQSMINYEGRSEDWGDLEVL